MPGKDKVKSKSTKATVIDTPEEAIRKSDNKEKDIKTILSIIENIDYITSSLSKDELIEKYTTIAKLADQMTRFGPDCIRNKYPVSWKDIYHIKILADSNPANLSTIISDISADLPILKNKLLFILKDEAEFINSRFEQTEIDHINTLTGPAPLSFGEKLINIERIIRKEYSSLIINKIRSEVQVDSDEISFDNRMNSYYIARKLTIIGELLKELPRGGTYSSLISTTQAISDIRDLLIHNHKQLLSIDSIVANILKTYTENIFTCLLKFTDSFSINKDVEQTLTTIYNLRSNASALILELEKLNEKEITSGIVVSNDVEASDRNNQDKLDKLIAAASNKLNGKAIPKTWEQLNEEYSALLSNIPNEIAKAYPPALNEEHKLKIQDLNSIIKANKEAQIKQENEAREIARISKAKDKLLDRLSQITNEYIFLQTLDSTHIPEAKKGYIQQHATNIIGEHMEKIRDEKEKVVIQDYHEISSLTLKSAQSGVIHLRKNGLSHDIFSFSAHKFDQILSDEIIPAEDDINSVYYILSNKGPQVSSARIMNNIGVAYVRLGLYTQAIEILLNAKKFIEDHPLEIQHEKMRSVGFVNIPEYIRFNDFDEMLIGVESYGYEIITNLAEAFLLNNQVGESSNLLSNLLTKIDLGAVEFSGTSKFRDSVAITINNLAASLYSAGNIEEASSWYKQACNIATEQDSKLLIESNLIKCLEKQNKQDEVLQIRNRLTQSENVYIELISKIDESHRLVAAENFIGAKKLVAESVSILETNKGKLKTIQGDRATLLDYDIIRAKLNIIGNEADFSAEQLQELVADFTRKYEKLKPNLRDCSAIGETQLFFSNAYATLSSRLAKNGLNGALDALNKAEQYFLSGEEKVTSIISKERSSRILAIAFSDYSTFSDEQTYFDKAIALHTKYNTNSDLTYNNWGAKKLNIAEKYFKKGDFKNAVIKYNEAIPFLEKAVETSTESIRSLGMCYEGLGDCTDDKDALKKAASFYIKFLLKTPNTSPDYDEVTEYRKNCTRKLRELETSPITSFVSLVPVKKSFSEVKLNEVEKKVLSKFQHLKESERSIKIKEIEKSDIEEFCRKRLGRSDIEVMKLPTGGYYFNIDSSIVATLKSISENKKVHNARDHI